VNDEGGRRSSLPSFSCQLFPDPQQNRTQCINRGVLHVLARRKLCLGGCLKVPAGQLVQCKGTGRKWWRPAWHTTADWSTLPPSPALASNRYKSWKAASPTHTCAAPAQGRAAATAPRAGCSPAGAAGRAAAGRLCRQHCCVSARAGGLLTSCPCPCPWPAPPPVKAHRTQATPLPVSQPLCKQAQHTPASTVRPPY
jgi:hypothetical protein